jgi:hypothetical protein
MVADDRSNPKNWLGPYADGDTGWLALRAAERPAYLASALAEFLELREWSPDTLARWLRCAPNQLAKLGLCHRPDPASAEFHQQVSEIVAHFQLDYWNLRRLLEDLALSPEQRHQIWQSEHPLESSRRTSITHRASGDFTRVFGASDMQAGAPRPMGKPEPPEPNHPALAPPPELPYESAQMAAGASLKVAPAHQRSWFGRLLDSIRNFFSRK